LECHVAFYCCFTIQSVKTLILPSSSSQLTHIYAYGLHLPNAYHAEGLVDPNFDVQKTMLLVLNTPEHVDSEIHIQTIQFKLFSANFTFLRT
jgi:hypothetical protein